MALNVKDPEVDRLARDLARRRGESIADVLRHALKEELRREERRIRAPGMADRLMEIGRRCAALPSYDERSDDEILGYDERGLFK